ncbi:terminase [Gordonia phage Moosehead]|nr:terminase [Gordonia phage Moosehead]
MTVSTPPRSDRRLSEVARHLVIPDGGAKTVFPRVYQRLQACGIGFDRWQQGLGAAALRLRADGKFAATVGGVVLSIPRQVGKTYTIGNLIIGLCLILPGLRVVWTSHHGRTTTNTFRSMQGMVRRKKIWPQLDHSGPGSPIRTANGEQEIRFANGSIIMFGAREQGFGRGMDAIDVEVFDEAQILGLKALEDMVPATNQARNPHGGLVFFMGTPPRPTDDGEAFWSKRERALSGKAAGLMYVEISADPSANPRDPSVYPTFNPSFPHRTPLEAMERMLENIPDEDAIRREMLGIWPTRGGGVIGAEQWAGLLDEGSEPVDPVAFAVYVNRDRSSAAIAVAGRREDGLFHVGVVPAASDGKADSLPGTAWIPDRVAELAERWSPCAVVVDEKSSAANLIPQIDELGVEVTPLKYSDIALACNNFYDAVAEALVRHTGAPALARSVVSGKRKDYGDTWIWDRKDPTSDVTQLMAVTLALHGLLSRDKPAPSVYEDHDLMIV